MDLDDVEEIFLIPAMNSYLFYDFSFLIHENAEIREGLLFYYLTSTPFITGKSITNIQIHFLKDSDDADCLQQTTFSSDEERFCLVCEDPSDNQYKYECLIDCPDGTMHLNSNSRSYCLGIHCNSTSLIQIVIRLVKRALVSNQMNALVVMKLNNLPRINVYAWKGLILMVCVRIIVTLITVKIIDPKMLIHFRNCN